MATKFFRGSKIQTNINMKSPKRNKDGDRTLVLLFRVQLNGNTVRSAPDVVKWAYDGVKTKGEDHVGIKKEIENMIGDFFETPEHKKATIRLSSLYLTNLMVKEVKTSKSDVAIVLTFQSEYPFDSTIWTYLGDKYGTDVFVQFDPAQASLIDVEDEDASEEEQGELLEEEEADEEETEEQATEA